MLKKIFVVIFLIGICTKANAGKIGFQGGLGTPVGGFGLIFSQPVVEEHELLLGSGTGYVSGQLFTLGYVYAPSERWVYGTLSTSYSTGGKRYYDGKHEAVVYDGLWLNAGIGMRFPFKLFWEAGLTSLVRDGVHVKYKEDGKSYYPLNIKHLPYVSVGMLWEI